MIFLFMFMLVTSAQARWIALDSAAKQGETHYFDPDTLHRNGQFRKIWVLSSFDEKQKGGYYSIKSLYEIDCMESKARSITMLLYPDKEGAGTVIGAYHEESQDWFGYSASSIFKHVAAAVCENKK